MFYAVVTFSFREQVVTVMEGDGLLVVFIDRVGSTDMDFSLRISGRKLLLFCCGFHLSPCINVNGPSFTEFLSA